MKITELRALDMPALQTLLHETETELSKSRQLLAAGELPNTRVVGTHRKSVAHIMTVMAELKRDTKNKEKT